MKKYLLLLEFLLCIVGNLFYDLGFSASIYALGFIFKVIGGCSLVAVGILIGKEE